MTDAELIEFAMSFREGILDGTPSDMMCAAVCWPLASLLCVSGVECTTDEAKDIPTDFGTCNHVWIRLADGRVLDPTADQFGERYPPVYLGPPIDIHRDSGSRAQREDPRSGAEAEGRQNGSRSEIAKLSQPQPEGSMNRGIEQDTGASASRPGSREPSPEGLGPTGFDPSRTAANTIPGYAEFLDRLVAAIPPQPVFASCALFPSDHALSFKHEGRDFVLAGPKFWEQIPVEAEGRRMFLLGGIAIIDIDNPREHRMRALVFDAMAAAMDSARDSDGSPEGRDREAGLDGEAATARAGTASPKGASQ